MDGSTPYDHWPAAAFRRRLLLAALIGATTVVGTGYMAMALPRLDPRWLEVTLLACFGILLAWISIGFWTSLVGCFLLLRGGDRWGVVDRSANAMDPRPLSPTAVVLPIYNENVDDVFGRLGTIYRSVRKTGDLDAFDFFVLSDSMEPEQWIEEENAWFDLCRREKAFERLFYRRRHRNTKRKSGNIADFCRRWGRRYDYMIVLDADSLMDGATMVDMVRTMDRRTDIGILQTLPQSTGGQSLLARHHQLISQRYGRMFAAGLHYWQMGDAQYWGHNAIIRTAPFMRHCALPRLAGPPPLGGDILSHDFVEAAFMRRAGWGVWIAYDLPGSYESPPATLIDELARDRRWCQGNLQHLRLVTTPGLPLIQRLLFVNGAMAYGSALIWLFFLVLSTAAAVATAFSEPDYFPAEGSLFPAWPNWDTTWLLVLLAGTMGVLFIPKLLGSVLAITASPRCRTWGGLTGLLGDLIVDVALSVWLAPIRMLAHSKFVLGVVVGRATGWNPPDRDKGGTPWPEALRFHGIGSLLAALWCIAVLLLSPGFFWWISPILLPLMLAAPISVMVSSQRLGRLIGRLGILKPSAGGPMADRPTDASRPSSAATAPRRDGQGRTHGGFTRIVVHPALLVRHIRMHAERCAVPAVNEDCSQLIRKAMRHGPDSLTAGEKQKLLGDIEGLKRLHAMVWELPAGPQLNQWGLSHLAGDPIGPGSAAAESMQEGVEP